MLGRLHQELGYHNGSLICGWLSKSVFSSGSRTTVERDWSQFSGHITRLRSVCLLPNPQVGKTISGSLGIWCCVPQLSQRHFFFFVLRWMPNCYCWGGGLRTSYLAILLMSLPEIISSYDSSWFKKREPHLIVTVQERPYTEKGLIDVFWKEEYMKIYKLERSIPVKQETSSTASHVIFCFNFNFSVIYPSDLWKLVSLSRNLVCTIEKIIRCLELTTQVIFRMDILF